MLSHSYMTLLVDGRSLGELKQGVTLQIFGEGHSMGPQTPAMRESAQKGARESGVPVDITWNSLSEYLAFAEKHGIAQNIASYIGATTLRIYAVGQDDRPAMPVFTDRWDVLPVGDGVSAATVGLILGLAGLVLVPVAVLGAAQLVRLTRRTEAGR